MLRRPDLHYLTMPPIRPLLALALAATIAALAGIPIAAASAGTTNEPIEITLERTACFGRCPVNTVTISGDGTVSYAGRQFVSMTGKQQSHVDPSAVRALVKEFEAIDSFALRDEYRSVENPDGTVTEVTDLPTQFVSLRAGGRSKRVEDYFGAKEPPRFGAPDRRCGGNETVGRDPSKSQPVTDQREWRVRVPTQLEWAGACWRCSASIAERR